MNKDVLRYIFTFLDIEDIISVRRICKDYKVIIDKMMLDNINKKGFLNKLKEPKILSYINLLILIKKALELLCHNKITKNNKIIDKIENLIQK